MRREIRCSRQDHRLPLLGNVEAPFELEMLLLIVIHEARNGIVVAAGEHA